MPIRRIPDADVDYYLIVFDEEGKERREPDGKLMSDIVSQRLTDPAAAATDVFLTSHGWKGDVPAAIEQYDAWIGAMLKLEADRAAAQRLRPNFKTLIVGLHWPRTDRSIGSADRGQHGGVNLSWPRLIPPTRSAEFF